ncbi:Outer membrane protein TolC [Tenacibaculum sp. MAR_2009_124]|uniref:TolC family protein n=1 Tax=Tenacibaculum sp. MAR_2009_124 TaxID=1250059 RepID=UPI00089779AA|nr:TolC family protein [Tenacibaculum sp. MAR_2009_124]SEB46901.1 Outer membrane protein TolC [Tenacibaculum sp. MAR_2009_124]
MRTNIVLTFLCTWLNALSFFAQTSTNYTPLEFSSFEEVISYANEHAISILNSGINEKVSKERKKASKAYLYPTINASGGYNNNLTLQPTLIPAQIFNPNAPSGTFEELTFGRQHIYSAGLQVNWNILNFQKIFASETANISAKQSKITTQKSKLSTYNGLASNYYSVILTQEVTKIYNENLKVSEAFYNHTKDKYERGIVDEKAVNTAEIRHIQNRKNLQKAKNNINRYYKQLQSQLNCNREISIEDTPDNFNLSSTFISSTHPDVVWQKMEVEKQKSILKESKSLLLPNLSFNYQYNKSWATDTFNDFSNVSELPQQTLGVKINIPVFSGFSSRKKIKQSKLLLQQQQLQLENIKLITQNEDKLLVDEVEHFKKELSENSKILKLTEKNDQHAENKYNSGIISLDDRLSSYDDLLNAQNAYLQSLSSYTLSKYKLYIRQIDLESQN